MGNYTEFNRVYRLIADGRTDFDSNINVSVFETNIRIVGGLLSAHLLAHRGEKYLGCLASVKSFTCKFKIGNFKSTCVSYPLLFALIEHGKYVFSIIKMLKGCRKCFFSPVSKSLKHIAFLLDFYSRSWTWARLAVQWPPSSSSWGRCNSPSSRIWHTDRFH